MDASSYLRLALRWWWLLILAMALGGVAAWFASSLISPTYRASSTLLVVHQGVDGALDSNDLEASRRIADTLVSLITTRPVIESVIEGGQFGLGVEEIRDNVVVQHARESQVIQIRVTAEEPTVARDIANGLATVFIASQATALPTTSISVVEAATTPSTPISPRRPVNAALGALLAGAICLVGLVLRERSDDTLSSVEDLQSVGLPALGLLRDTAGTEGPTQRPGTYHPDSERADDYRRVGANLVAVLAQHSASFGRKVVLVTSAYPHTGAAVTANLAVSLGAAGYRVLLVDGDLREPTLHRMFSIPNGEGLAVPLRNGSPPVARRLNVAHDGSTVDAPAQSAAHDSPSSNGRVAPYSTVFLVSAGSASSNAGDLLGSGAMRSAVEEWRAAYDVVLVHGSSLDRPEAEILATVTDAIVVVAQAGQTRAGDLSRVVGRFTGPRSIVAGVILDADRAEALPEREPLADQPRAQAVAPTPTRAAARSRQRLSRFRQDTDPE